MFALELAWTPQTSAKPFDLSYISMKFTMFQILCLQVPPLIFNGVEVRRPTPTVAAFSQNSVAPLWSSKSYCETLRCFGEHYQ